MSREEVKKHCYWSLFSDFLNLLAHASVVEVLMSSKRLMEKYASILECFTGMDWQKRAIYEHLEYESGNYLTAFSVEIEACSSPLWALISRQHNMVRLPITEVSETL